MRIAAVLLSANIRDIWMLCYILRLCTMYNVQHETYYIGSAAAAAAAAATEYGIRTDSMLLCLCTVVCSCAKCVRRRRRRRRGECVIHLQVNSAHTHTYAHLICTLYKDTVHAGREPLKMTIGTQHESY